ncbi:MAG: hypothetical protein WC498_00365 [Candidatus Saccharimonadales bacterium]
MSKLKRLVGVLVLWLLLFVGTAPLAHAVCSPDLQTCSASYGVNEAFFGTGGELNACSASYCSKQAAGETAVGNTTSTSYKAQAGFNTDRIPSLTFVVNTTNINLGVLTPGTTATANTSFSVKSYLSSGYIVQTVGNAPTYGGHQLSPLTTATASNPAAEQFGLNLVANTSPVAFGTNPVQIPDSTFSFGLAATGYNTANFYRYNNGDTIAQSNSSSGETDYTMSYIFNTTALTPGGTYTMSQGLVATATF